VPRTAVQRSSDRARRYPPLIGGVISVLLAALVLPSALNVPQSNPTQTLEFAPVPPEGDETPPPQGNVESLSLGTTSGPDAGRGAGTDEFGDPAAAPPLPVGTGERPSTKRCVGNPPRQTEDPISPPCVAYFDGDNGGATYEGVSTTEVRVLFYLDNFCTGTTSRGPQECPPADGGTFDLADPPEGEEHVEVRLLRALQRYFNTRYQTYNRFVHLYVVYGSVGDAMDSSPEMRRAAARAHLEHPDPFAVLAYLRHGAEQDYLDATAEHGRLNFGSYLARPAEFYRRHPGLIWSYTPSIEESAAVYAGYVCNRVVPFAASFTGNDQWNGQPRKLALLRPTDERRPTYDAFADEVRRRIQECGGEFATEGTYPFAGTATGARTGSIGSNQTAAAANIADFVRQGVTTVVWTQGYDGGAHSDAAANADYRPEWIVAGDGNVDGYQTGQLQDQSVWDGHAWTVTPVTLVSAIEDSNCYRAYHEADPSMPAIDITFACQVKSYYNDLTMLFTGIQVAGPRLTPGSMDRGFHAIPPVVSPDPSTPACFYRPGDYTCVKDAAAAWWDGSGQIAGNATEGCWRYSEGGLRYFAEAWPDADVLESRSSTNPCNDYAGAVGSA